MRWQVLTKKDIGKIRVRRKFLFLPMRLDCFTRWLEMASWEEKVCGEIALSYERRYIYVWKPTKWLD